MRHSIYDVWNYLTLVVVIAHQYSSLAGALLYAQN